jgi:hypothetical protein
MSHPYGASGIQAAPLAQSLLILGMDLLDGGSQLQFLRRISKHFLVRRAVIKTIPTGVDDRDHIRSILGDDFKQLIALGQFATNSLELELLIDRVDIE